MMGEQFSSADIAASLGDRPNIERYQTRMNSSTPDKVARVYPVVDQFTDMMNPTIVSIGAGTGQVEDTLSDLLQKKRPTFYMSDLSVPMLETINGVEMAHRQRGRRESLRSLQAEALFLPFRSNSVDVVLALSVNHEIISREGNFILERGLTHASAEVGRILRKGQVYIVRDFMQPSIPEEIVQVRVGTQGEKEDAVPVEFVHAFINQFKGADTTWQKLQIQKLVDQEKWMEGATIQMDAGLALEVLIHYSWAKSFEEEKYERYAYLPVGQYARFIQTVWKKQGIQSKVISTQTYLQPGYEEHINGRLDCFHLNGKPYPLPPFTGLVVIQKL
ncbi:hypothetical protein C5B42_05490 [Candidatus Cerribacteria bacterium 'Amazon FNV 2010 28 9']|uniref:Methyltransferase type 11 domain-containing protein n=1 Tax=Candidatus Cerribacteria bacterium 'Amazon FNV 2010 28 9' TaxID=2081795 RepID=A0A317JMF5_9BACT|nr:MAG: hypothetical protein C5B42_05490 [Candidatus Cerribacteria bacterium 'Amazon FNV 2010 28 9']